jgi:hypothetical protein
MCVPLRKMFKETHLDSIKVQNFYPYIDSEKKYGYFLKQPDGTYKDMSLAKWRSILHGQISKLRPKTKLPKDNRIEVMNNDTKKKIKICYWPDTYLDCYNSGFKKKSKSSDTTLGDSKILAQFTKKSLEGNSFAFLKSQKVEGIFSIFNDNSSKSGPGIIPKLSKFMFDELSDSSNLEFEEDLSIIFPSKKRENDQSVTKSERPNKKPRFY